MPTESHALFFCVISFVRSLDFVLYLSGVGLIKKILFLMHLFVEHLLKSFCYALIRVSFNSHILKKDHLALNPNLFSAI